MHTRQNHLERYIKALGVFWRKFRLGRYGPYIGTRDDVDVSTFASTGQSDSDGRDVDLAHAAFQAYALKLYGGGVVFNAGATQSGADWSLTFVRPDTGMTENVTLIWPSDTPAPGEVLTVTSYALGVAVLEWAPGGGGGGQVDSIVAGDGIDVDSTDPVNPVDSALISTDGGNALSFGSDDGLYAAAGGGITYTDTGILVSGGVIGGTAIVAGALASEARGMSVGVYDYSTADPWQLWVYPVPASGSFELGIYKRSFGNVAPSSGDSIVASAPPVLNGNASDFTATGSTSTWTGSLVVGDMLTLVPTVNTALVQWWAILIPARRTF